MPFPALPIAPERVKMDKALSMRAPRGRPNMICMELDQHMAAKLLGISVERLRRLAEIGSIPHPNRFLEHLPYWNERTLKAATPLWRSGIIYFIRSEAFIKIGFAGSLKQRLLNLQSATPFELTVMHSMAGTLAREGEILDAFADIRCRGEWFRDEPPLRSFIERLKTRGDRPYERIREP